MCVRVCVDYCLAFVVVFPVSNSITGQQQLNVNANQDRRLWPEHTQRSVCLQLQPQQHGVGIKNNSWLDDTYNEHKT